MKQLITKIAAVLMTMVVLFSTMSFSVNAHYCGEHLVDFALFSKAESCGMEMEQPITPEDCGISKDNCCNDVVLKVQGQDELNITIEKIDRDAFVAFQAFAYSYINLFEGLETNVIPFKHYIPPLLIKDIQVLDEVFLI